MKSEERKQIKTSKSRLSRFSFLVSWSSCRWDCVLHEISSFLLLLRPSSVSWSIELCRSGGTASCTKFRRNEQCTGRHRHYQARRATGDAILSGAVSRPACLPASCAAARSLRAPVKGRGASTATRAQRSVRAGSRQAPPPPRRQARRLPTQSQRRRRSSVHYSSLANVVHTARAVRI